MSTLPAGQGWSATDGDSFDRIVTSSEFGATAGPYSDERSANVLHFDRTAVAV